MEVTNSEEMTAEMTEQQALCPMCAGPGRALHDHDADGAEREDLYHFPFECQRCKTVWRMPLWRYERACRDCGRRGGENPDDIQPGLCPACAKRRLERVMVGYERHLEEYGAALTRDWLTLAFVEDAGMTKAWASLKAEEFEQRLLENLLGGPS